MTNDKYFFGAEGAKAVWDRPTTLQGGQHGCNMFTGNIAKKQDDHYEKMRKWAAEEAERKRKQRLQDDHSTSYVPLPVPVWSGYSEPPKESFSGGGGTYGGAGASGSWDSGSSSSSDSSSSSSSDSGSSGGGSE